jgi:FdhD protein
MRAHPCTAHGAGAAAMISRMLPEETPVALVYGGSTEAVLMATPADLEDFAIGFSLTEGLIERPEDIAELSVVHGEDGVELRMWLRREWDDAYRRRRRRLTGPTGCGLCGIESLAEAVRPPCTIAAGGAFEPEFVAGALEALSAAQTLKRETRSTHAAAFVRPGQGLIAIREDVGRHNALDKLAGALRSNGTSVNGGAVVITSRVSVEMVQKGTAIGAPLLIAMSAPTALAVRMAAAAQLTLVASARSDSWQVFTHPERMSLR